MGEHRAFGEASGTTGVEQPGGRIFIDFDVVLLCRSGSHEVGIQKVRPPGHLADDDDVLDR